MSTNTDTPLALPAEMDATVCGLAKAIWILLGRTPPLSMPEIEAALQCSTGQAMNAKSQLEARGFITYDERHGGYRRDYQEGDDDEV